METNITLNKIIYSVKELFNQYSDDNTFSNELLAFKIGELRSDFIMRHYNSATNFIPDSLYTKLCMDIEKHPDSCYENINILRTVNPLPKYFNFSEKSAIKNLSIGSLSTKYMNYISLERIPYFTFGRYSQSQIYYSIDPDGRLLLITKDRVLLNDSIYFSIVAHNVEEAFKYRCDNEADKERCYDFYDDSYPVDGITYNAIIQSLTNEFMVKFRIPQDDINDGTNSNQQIPNHTYNNYDKQRRRDNNQE